MASRVTWVVGSFLLIASCKTIPEDSYGISHLRFRGMEQLDPEALRSCLATQERDRVTLSFGTTADPVCGVPPFDGDRVAIDLWKKPRKGWPTLDLAVFERDLQRVERWYKARGYYDATVVGTEFNPPSAASSDRVGGKGPDAPCEREEEGEGCPLSIAVEVEEGKPVLVRSIDVQGHRLLSPRLRRSVERAIQMQRKKPFDEAHYDKSRKEMRRALNEASHACAAVTGRVDVHREERTADVYFTVDPGPPNRIGDVTVEGNRDLPAKTVLSTASLRSGDKYAPSDLADAQRSVYAIGAFASVNVTGTPRVDGSDICTGVVDVVIAVEPGRRIRWGIGGGVQAGTLETFRETEDAAISDVHLFGLFEHRNFLGGLRRLRIEDRPKVVARDPLFRFARNGALLGNELKVELRWPSFIEDRTIMTARFRHDYGPDPIQFFLRHDLSWSARLSRSFLDGVLTVSGGLNFDLFFVVGRDRPDLPNNFRVLFLDERVQIDLRDDSRNPRRGFFFSVGSQQSPIQLFRSWQYIRVTPEVAGYFPLPLSSTLAMRFGVGAMFIFGASDKIDQVGAELGPQNYRLRSGGPTSHRGFVAGFLGPQMDPDNPDFLVNSGGLRRWEASVEWRVPITPSFGTAVFTDVGDVNRDLRQGAGGFRFDYLHAAVGFGFRYQIPGIGPARLDLGFLIPRGQIIGEPPPPTTFKMFGKVPGALHFTIGEAF